MRARATLVGLAVIALSLTETFPSAQAISRESVEDKVLGWIKIYDDKSPTRAFTVDQRVYSPAQEGTARLFVKWMQATYLPVGALGDVLIFHNPKLTQYNQYTGGLPQIYGAFGKLYTELKYGPTKKIVPQTNSHLVWTMEANGVYGIPASAISTPEHYYFTLPTFAQQTDGDGALEKAADVSRHPVLGKFPTFFARNSATGNRKYVLLSKDHRLPFATLTKGEYLDALEVAIGRWLTERKKEITEAGQSDPKRMDFDVKNADDKTTKRLAVLQKNREKYRSRLREPAAIWTDQPDVLLENYPDVFEGNGGTAMRLPVYTIDPQVAALCKSDAPQWIVISWTAHLNDPVNLALHQAILNNLDVEYIYNYFFDPAKVAGQPYKPLRSPSATETAVVGAPLAKATANAADPKVHFFEDFSTGTVGQKPLNWRSTLDAAGASSVVTELKGLDGHWASMNGYRVAPTQMKSPLPPDFEVSYDVVAAQNYTWGAHGLTFKLSRTPKGGAGESFVSVRIRPGFGGREGSVNVEGQFPGAPGYLSGSQSLGAPGFSNDDVNNRVTVTLSKKGELLRVFIGRTKIAEYEKAIPASFQFDALSFELYGNEAKDQMFIGNIKVAAN